MTLDDALRRENNNADLFRLIAALAVIWGHAFALSPREGEHEPIGALLGFDYSGSLAVKFFFFLSGILVTSSWLRQPSPVKFAVARIVRIFPALIVSGSICMLVIGPMLTSLPLGQYFGNTWMYIHIFKQPYMGYVMPGVFQNNAYQDANGSLWTICYELLMYAALLALAMCGLLRLKVVAAFACGAVIVWFLYRPDSISIFGLPNNNDAGRLPAFFSFGVLLALFKEKIRIDARVVLGTYLLAWLLRNGPVFEYAFYAAFLLTPLWLMTLRPIKALKLPGDYSYGVYVYGWPIQQTITALFPDISLQQNQLFSIAVAIAVGAASWHFLEKPFVKVGHRLPDVLQAIRPMVPTRWFSG
jgi:peptidoglycan/LPS O-acetylase OafA/YrhL